MGSFAERSEKYGKKRFSRSEGIKFNFDLPTMTLFCSYILSENSNIHRSSLISMRELFNVLDEESFEGNTACIARLRFCKSALVNRLDKSITSRDILLRETYGIMGNNFPDISPDSLYEVSNEDVSWVEDTIASCCRLTFINNSIVDFGNLCSDYVMTDYTNKYNIANQIKDKVEEIQNVFRKHESSSITNSVVDCSEVSSTISDMFQEYARPSYRLKTGMQGLNGILAGGFEGGKVYSFFGLPGEGKTTTLLNVAYQIKKFNKDYVCRDKTKRPCVVILTMENTKEQVIESLFNIACDERPINEFPMSHALQLFNMQFAATPEDPITIIIDYKPIKSVNSNYLYELTSNLEDQGYEVIAMVQDYIKRIRPIEYNNDMRLDTGNVINDFRNYAIFKNIPVITASQLNREGVKTVDMARNANKRNIVESIGRNMIGESGLIEENLDASIFIAKEFIDGKIWMGFELKKTRYRIFTKYTTFYQPFEHGIKYATDTGLSNPLFKKSLDRTSMEVTPVMGEVVKIGGHREIKDINDPTRGQGPKNLQEAILGETTFTGFITPPPIPMASRMIKYEPPTREGFVSPIRFIKKIGVA